MNGLLILSALLAVATALPAEYGVPAAQVYAAPIIYDDLAVPTDYKFGLDINDDITYNQQTREESKYGDVVSGVYTVLQPDGQTRIVRYQDNGYGLQADVSYQAGYSAPVYSAPVYSAPVPAY